MDASVRDPADAADPGGAFNGPVNTTTVDLGSVTAPSGVLVLGTAGWTDQRPESGAPLSVRAAAAVAAGGGHLCDDEAEAVAVPAAADRPLPVRAATAPSLFDGQPVVSVLEVDLGLPWPGGHSDGPVPLGELPVDRCGTVVGDAVALDSFVGLGGESVDGLADLTYWGREVEAARAEFGGERIQRLGGDLDGWLDLPEAEAWRLGERLQDWVRSGPGTGLVHSVQRHTHFHLVERAGQNHPLLAGTLDLAGSRILGLGWDPGDHAVRHSGERAFGCVHPVALHRSGGSTVLRWTVTADEDEPDDGAPDRPGDGQAV